jgi:hypothetical protein
MSLQEIIFWNNGTSWILRCMKGLIGRFLIQPRRPYYNNITFLLVSVIVDGLGRIYLALKLYWVCSLDEWFNHRVNHPKVGSPRLYKKASDSTKIGRLSPATPYIRSVRLFKNRTVCTQPRRPYLKITIVTPCCHIFSAKGSDLINEWITPSSTKPNIIPKPRIYLALGFNHRVNHPKDYYSNAGLSYIFKYCAWSYQTVIQSHFEWIQYYPRAGELIIFDLLKMGVQLSKSDSRQSIL